MLGATSERLDMLDKKMQQLASGLYSPLFATQDSIKDAIHYAYTIAKASENPAAITTALHVVLNTVAQYIENKVREDAQTETDNLDAWLERYESNVNHQSREG